MYVCFSYMWFLINENKKQKANKQTTWHSFKKEEVVGPLARVTFSESMWAEATTVKEEWMIREERGSQQAVSTAEIQSRDSRRTGPKTASGGAASWFSCAAAALWVHA